MFTNIQNMSGVLLTPAERNDFLEVVEPTVYIKNEEEFFNWTQTELQRIFPHGKLICAEARVAKQGARIRKVLNCNFPDEYVRTLTNKAGLTTSPIIIKWLQEQRPILFDPMKDTKVYDKRAKWLENFQEYQLGNVAAHGVRDVRNNIGSYFSFSSIPEKLTRRHSYLLKLLVPYLHTALLRVFSNPSLDNVLACKEMPKLTIREQEILQWLVTGKSNLDIALALKLSESTVKKHIHKVLSKLQVSTRTEAVVKVTRF